jgi:hypothetical protein
MRERGRVQLQFMKTRSSSAVGTKIELEFNTTSLRITDLDENSPEAPTTVDVLHDRLRRQSNVGQSNVGNGSSGPLDVSTAPWATESPKKNEPSVGIRTMDSNNKLNSILKKV